jgi:hypothetical protein
MQDHPIIFSIKDVKARIKVAYPDGIPNKKHKIEIIKNWQANLAQYIKAKEEEIKPLFFPQIFGEILDYELYDTKKCTLQFEKKTNIDSTKADAALGFFKTKQVENGLETTSDIRVAIEVKDGQTNLDYRQNRKDFKGSAVEQAFAYAAKMGEKCKWVIVSNFKEIRLYLASDMTKYEYFDLTVLDDDYEFSRFYYLLAQKNLFLEHTDSNADVMLAQRIEKEKTITAEFYAKYHFLRELFYYHLKTYNPEIPPFDLLEYAQTILDRVVFISVVKDYGLVPYNILKEIEEISTKSWAKDKSELWRQLKNLFAALDEGFPQRLQKFNGGLFRQNPKIDNLIIRDIFLKKLLVLNTYDFESDLNSNILGHIFEQSINDIEELKQNILDNNEVKYIETEEEINLVGAKSLTGLRKKDGIFYTPENITAYMISSTVGEWLEEHKNSLELTVEEKTLSDFDTIAAFENYQKNRLQNWEKYAEILRNIKILDPACGSGAFLTQAFDFLLAEWLIVRDVLTKLKGETVEVETKGFFNKMSDEKTAFITQIKKEIVNKNLFGVDLNFESVEITKLGLWLKSASKNDSLVQLEDNIKTGNSLIADKTVTEKAFVWETQFAEIMANGGFDVVVGNPPYVDSKKLKLYSAYFSQHYHCYAGTADLYVYFFELAFRVMKINGCLGFINSNKFMKTSYGENLRQFLSTKNIRQIIDFTDYRVFEDALVASAILVVRNNAPSENIKISFVTPKRDTYEFLKDYVHDHHFFTKSSHLDKEIWFLSANGKIPVKRKIEENTVKLQNIEGIAIFRGVTTGYNEAFIIDETTKKQLIVEDAKNAEIIKPLLQGRNIRKWFYNESNLYLIFTRKGIDIQRHKAVEKYLSKFKNELEPGRGRKEGTYEWYEIQDNTAYYPEFDKEKIIWGLTADKWAYCYDDKGHFLPSNGYILTSNSSLSLKYILGILNSKVMRFYFNFIGIMTAGGAFTLKYDTVADFPFKIVAPDDQKTIIQTVDFMLNLHKKMEKQKQSFLRMLIANVKTLQIKGRLQTIYEYEFADLLIEFEKQKINLTIKEQSKLGLEEFFYENKREIVAIAEQIKQTDKHIDNLVYKLYNLSSEEIEIIEKSFEK